MILLEQTFEPLTHLNNASLPMFIETDPIAVDIIANLPGFIYWKNEKGQYKGANNNLARVSGLNDRSEIVGKTDDDFEWGKGLAEHLEKTI